jgi:hypothetical protein
VLPLTDDENEKLAVLESIVPVGPANATVCGGEPADTAPLDATDDD